MHQFVPQYLMDNFRPLPYLCGIIVFAARSFFIYLSYQQHKSMGLIILSIHGDMKADKTYCQSAGLSGSPAFIFPGDPAFTLSLELFPPHSVQASVPWLFKKRWPFTAATDRHWWSAWRVVVRQVRLISLWAGWCCATLQKILLWACKATSHDLLRLGYWKTPVIREIPGKRVHMLVLADGGGGGLLLSVLLANICLFK